MNVAGKDFASVLNDKVNDLTDRSVMDEQGGFRSGRDALIRYLQYLHLQGYDSHPCSSVPPYSRCRAYEAASE